MINIRLSKKNIIWIVSVICIVFITGTELFNVLKIKELNNIIKNKEVELKNIQEENCKLIEKYEEYEKCLKVKDDKIVELEKAIEDYESKSIPKIDTSKKTYMDYRSISRSSKQGGIVYGDEAWTDEDGLRNNYRIIL